MIFHSYRHFFLDFICSDTGYFSMLFFVEYIILILPILPCQYGEKDKHYFINISLTVFPEESLSS